MCDGSRGPSFGLVLVWETNANVVHLQNLAWGLRTPRALVTSFMGDEVCGLRATVSEQGLKVRTLRSVARKSCRLGEEQLRKTGRRRSQGESCTQPRLVQQVERLHHHRRKSSKVEQGAGRVGPYVGCPPALTVVWMVDIVWDGERHPYL